MYAFQTLQPKGVTFDCLAIESTKGLQEPVSCLTNKLQSGLHVHALAGESAPL